MITSETTYLYFADRYDAGRQLATKLVNYAGRPDTIVLGLPRGGIPVAFEVARCLDLPLDAFVVRKLGVPGHKELALGAIASGGIRSLNKRIINSLNITPEIIKQVEAQEQVELSRREVLYRNQRPLILKDKAVIVVDDGIASGTTTSCSVHEVRSFSPQKLVLATAVSSPEAAEILRPQVDEFITLYLPENMYSIGQFYNFFPQVTDDQVVEILHGRDNLFGHHIS
jgi:putative phosphoribosyl transferase